MKWLFKLFHKWFGWIVHKSQTRFMITLPRPRHFALQIADLDLTYLFYTAILYSLNLKRYKLPTDLLHLISDTPPLGSAMDGETWQLVTKGD